MAPASYLSQNGVAGWEEDLKRAVQGWIDWELFLLLWTWIFFLWREVPSPPCNVCSRTTERNWWPIIIIAWSGKVPVIRDLAPPDWCCVDLRWIQCYDISSLAGWNRHSTSCPRHKIFQILQHLEPNFLWAPSEDIQVQDATRGPPSVLL
jgi:hypothetical protein